MMSRKKPKRCYPRPSSQRAEAGDELRESELIQKYLQEHGKMPRGGDDLDDLF